ncbi:MAG: bifunctional adenosylcobinamide kinase/adenosylcobinamide-phosphate guanylyltransferase [Saccharospirillaceae bacterium]|nr:bifunctional adenosylcobinamide kinase/adenosylcobinamide-phosphate guanylyltransferase [Pseudomonadales bacterium]NRB78321.1 bifunctional adenosylcobinamide kinase/adenosylcobinamide-phosphate guanylyltransferase [Saccharospirillaceae bacterium]
MLQLILGGTRSGKSVFAEKQIKQLETQNPQATVSYIATAELFDQGMKDRAKQHADRRPQHWQLIEAPLQLTQTLNALNSPDQIILLDCLTLWLNNVIYYQSKNSQSKKSQFKPNHEQNQSDQSNSLSIKKSFDDLLHCLTSHQANIVLVSNEVGLGILPMDKSTREFADYCGVLNQQLANIVQKAYLITAGLPITLKG